MLVTQIFASWNRMTSWLRQLDHLRTAAYVGRHVDPAGPYGNPE